MRNLIDKGFVALGFIALALLGVALYFSDGRFGKSSCEMTYMHPIFMENWPPLQRGENPHLEGPKRCERTRYRVFRYFEGRVSPDYQQPKGDPVLFVPGHLGSFMQARTLGSQVGPNVTVYAIDFLAQPAGLSGSLLRRQAEFVNEAAYAISALHGGKPLVIVGHSMGAVAAWGSQFLPAHHSVQVSTFFSICAPLKRPILLAEKGMYEFYDRMHRNRNSTAIKDIVLLSLSCGRRDALVPSTLCATSQIFSDSTRVIHAPASNLSGFSVDHQAVLWCNPIASRVAQAVTKAASLNLTAMTPQERRREIARTLFARAPDAEDLTPQQYEELEQRMIASERPRVKRKLSSLTFGIFVDYAINALVMGFRANWTRLFAFAFASCCLISFEAARRSHADVQRDAEEFVDVSSGIVNHNKEEERSIAEGIVTELEMCSLWNQIKGITEISPPTLPLFAALFIHSSLKDEEKEFVNLWFFFASQAIIQLLFVVVYFLRRFRFMKWLGSNERRARRILFVLWAGLNVGLYALFKPAESESLEYDVSHLLLCIGFLTTFFISFLSAFWVVFCWGYPEAEGHLRKAADVRLGVCLGLLHIMSVCDSLGAALLAWDALMMSSPWPMHSTEQWVVPPPFPSRKSATSSCKERLDEKELQVILSNFLMLVPWFFALYRLCALQRKPKFVLLEGEWGDFEFATAPASVSTDVSKRSARRSVETQRSQQGTARQNGHSTALAEVNLVPYKLANGEDQYLEILSDVDYDEKEPSKLVELKGGDIVQIDTLKAVPTCAKDEDAETIYIGRDVNLAERRRKWSRPYHARVRVNQLIAKFPVTAIMQLGGGLFFLSQSQQLIWIFPCTCVIFSWFTATNAFFNRPSQRMLDELEVTRYQRGG